MNVVPGMNNTKYPMGNAISCEDRGNDKFMYTKQESMLSESKVTQHEIPLWKSSKAN